jgi:hypothetical protein
MNENINKTGNFGYITQVISKFISMESQKNK